LADHKTLRVTREQFSRDPQYFTFLTVAQEECAAVFSGQRANL